MKISDKARTRIKNYSKVIFCMLSWILLLCIFIQIYYAGRAQFYGDNWGNHLMFINIFEFIPAFMYIFGSAGFVPQKYKAWSMMLFILVNLQYYSTYGWMVYFHAAFAIVILVISIYVAWGSVQILFKREKKTNQKKLAV